MRMSVHASGPIEGECVENILHNGRCFADVTTKMRRVLTIQIPLLHFPPMMMSSSFIIGPRGSLIPTTIFVFAGATVPY